VSKLPSPLWEAVVINFFSPRGRIDRRTYLALVFLWLLAVALLQPLILGLPDFTSSGRLLNELWDGNAREWGVQVDAYVHTAGNRVIRYSAYGVLWLAALASFLCLSAKRLHDLGRPGRYVWIGLLPFIGAQALFYVLVFLPGDEGDNRYGALKRTRLETSSDDIAAAGARLVSKS
jgi:uncharacterized membrane protein YhaH (DUF805 family)